MEKENIERYIPKINLADYNYELPKERIAEFPLSVRSSSKLLVAYAAARQISHHRFMDIPELLPEESLLVLNVTKVIAARLNMAKLTGGRAEVLCVEPVEPSVDPQITMSARGRSVWRCIIGGPRIRKSTQLAIILENGLHLNAKVLEKDGSDAVVEFKWQPEDMPFATVIEYAGKIPLPPYIKRAPVDSDTERYQTVYANYQGSVAAPTAGLHFTDEVLYKVKSRGIEIQKVTLHVGPGTFKPIDAENIAGHVMHSERISVSLELIESLINHLRKYGSKPNIIATGTTTLRTLESIYWLGTMILLGHDWQDGSEFFVGQWIPYKLINESVLPAPLEAVESIYKLMKESNIEEISGRTQILIVPGYEFKFVSHLITNYHMPGSTLMLLVAAFVGKQFIKEVYDEALKNDYRFLSYGDSSLLIRV